MNHPAQSVEEKDFTEFMKDLVPIGVVTKNFL